MTNRSIAVVGRALYGESTWRGKLAEKLGVSPRTLRRWELGEMPVPEGVWGECNTLLREREREIARAKGGDDVRHR
jgi:hypothetical protein